MRVKNQKIRVKNEGLIKCLKGHNSVGSLCNVVKALIVSGNRQSYHLFWTAKKAGLNRVNSCIGLKSRFN